MCLGSGRGSGRCVEGSDALLCSSRAVAVSAGVSRAASRSAAVGVSGGWEVI